MLTMCAQDKEKTHIEIANSTFMSTVLQFWNTAIHKQVTFLFLIDVKL